MFFSSWPKFLSILSLKVVSFFAFLTPGVMNKPLKEQILLTYGTICPSKLFLSLEIPAVCLLYLKYHDPNPTMLKAQKNVSIQ